MGSSDCGNYGGVYKEERTLGILGIIETHRAVAKLTTQRATDAAG